MVDNGVLRLNEVQQVNNMLNKDLGVNLMVVDASELFLSRLEGVEDPKQKRKIIGNTFITVSEEEAAKIEAAADGEEKAGAAAEGRVEWLLQGTLYPDSSCRAIHIRCENQVSGKFGSCGTDDRVKDTILVEHTSY